MKNIINKIIKGDLSRDNDEAYAEGFWDKAGYINSLKDTETIYASFWEIFEKTTKQILEKQNEKLRKLDLNTYTAEDIICENKNMINKL